MKKLLAFILSILIHLLIFYNLLNIDDPVVISEEEKAMEIKIVKKEKEIPGKTRFKKSEVNIEDINTDNTNIEIPGSSNYLSENSMLEPTLLSANSFEKYVSKSSSSNNSSFQSSLESILPEVEIFEDETEEQLSINWDGDSRSLNGNYSIDFNQFPKSSFTGVGVTITFMVSSRGDVYGAKIKPPGSGSVEFDVLIIEYLSKMKFEEGTEDTKGEIHIVYE